MSIPEFSVKRPVTVTMLIGIVVVLGVYSLLNLGLDLLPDISYPSVSVLTRWEGAAPEDVERQLTQPLEEMLALISGVKGIKSFSREGMSVIIVEFEWGTNLDFAAQDIRDQISTFKHLLPEGAEDPLVLKFDVSLMPIAAYAYTGDIDFNRLHDIAEDVIKARLERIEGVAAVSVWGWRDREVQVLLDPAKITAMGIDPQNIRMALMFNNVNMPAGYVVDRNKEYLLRTYGEFRSLDEVGDVVVGMTKDYKPVHLRDVAEIRFSNKEVRGRAEVSGREGLWIMISKESGANTVNVMRKVLKEVDEIKEILPKNTKLYKMFDMSELIRRVIARTRDNGIVGALLAMLFIFIFLRSIRPTVAISLAIPLSIIATFIAIWAAGYTLNLMTMVGLMLGVGMLVDNAVVVIENIYRLIEEGHNRIVAAGKGAAQVGMAITASTLTTIAVFFPVLFVPGITGQLSKGFALTIAFALLSSLFVALTIVPVIAAQIFKREGASSMRGAKWFEVLREKYVRLLAWCLDHKAATLAAVAFLFLASIALYPLVGGEFIPKFDPPFTQVFFSLPRGTPIEQTIDIAHELASVAEAEPDVLFSGMIVGRIQGSEFDLGAGSQGTPTNVNEGAVFMRLKFKENRKKTSYQITEELRRVFPKLRDSRFVVVDMSSQMFGGAISGDIEVKIFGQDLSVLRRLANTALERIKKIEGVGSIQLSYREGLPELRIIPNKEKCARLGLSAAQVANAIKTYTLGAFAGRFNDPSGQIDIVVKLDEAERSKISQIMSLPVVSPTGAVVPLSQVADTVRVIGPVEIQREDQKRKVSLGITVREGYDLRRTTAKVKKAMLALYNSPAWEEGYVFEIGGQAKQMKDLFKWMTIAIVVALLLVYMVMASQFESFLHPFVIMFTEPLCIIGVMWALLITGKTLSLPSFMGVVILAGIVVNNGIVLVDFVNQLRREKGYGIREALLEAGRLRMRPVLITALTTIFGMLPMALSRSQGSEMRSPMAIAVIGGLATATFLTLLVIPVVYSIFERVSEKAVKGTKRLLGVDEE